MAFSRHPTYMLKLILGQINQNCQVACERTEAVS
jgi:hypothetical protein